MPFRIRPARDALFLDIDGTLLDIAAAPRQVHVPLTLTITLQRLYYKLDGALALVSGRTLQDMDELFAPLRLPAAGVHGAEWRLSPEAKTRRGRGLPHHLAGRVKAQFVNDPGILVEDKNSALAVHYRRAPERRQDIQVTLRKLITRYESTLTLIPGNMVLEIVRTSYNKATAIKRFMRRAPFAGRRPLFIGDDEADMPAITACLSLGGRAARVGAQDLGGHGFPHPESVRDWLARQLV